MAIATANSYAILAIVASNKDVDLIKQKLIAASLLCNNPDNLIQSYQKRICIKDYGIMQKTYQLFAWVF